MWDPSLPVLEQTLDLCKVEKEPREVLGEEGAGMLSSRWTGIGVSLSNQIWSFRGPQGFGMALPLRITASGQRQGGPQVQDSD